MAEMPEWVSMWTWMRFMRNPPSFAAFPEQQLPESMSAHQYAELRRQWETAGCPSVNPAEVTAALSLGDMDIPF